MAHTKCMGDQVAKWPIQNIWEMGDQVAHTKCMGDHSRDTSLQTVLYSTKYYVELSTRVQTISEKEKKRV